MPQHSCDLAGGFTPTVTYWGHGLSHISALCLMSRAHVPAVVSGLYPVLLGHVFPFAEEDSSSLDLNATQPSQNLMALPRERRSLGELGVWHLVIVGHSPEQLWLGVDACLKYMSGDRDYSAHGCVDR